MAKEYRGPSGMTDYFVGVEVIFGRDSVVAGVGLDSDFSQN